MTSTKGSTDPEATRIVSIKDLADKVEALAAQIVSGAGKPGGGAVDSRETPGGGSLDDQVTRAVEAAREREAAKSTEEAKKKAVEDRIKALEERTEKRPVERSRLSKWLWGEE